MAENTVEATNPLLIVDDSEENLSVLERLLKHLGYQVDLCKDGLEALDRVSLRSYEMIFTDVNMPRMNGIEFLQSIRSKGDSTPVIMITGFPSITLAVESMKKGASDFITKPFQVGHIEHIITRTLKEKSLQQKNRFLEEELRNKNKIEELNINLRNKIEELSILYSIGEMVCHSENMEDLFDKMIETASAITKGEEISILLVDREADALIPKRVRGNRNRLYPIPLGDGLIGKAVMEKRSLLTPAGESNHLGNPGNFLALPMTIKDEVIGAMNISKASPFSDKELHLLDNMVSKFTMAIENHALYESIYENLTDTLRSLVMAVEAKDLYTKDHSQRVTDLAILIANEMGRSKDELETLRFSGFIHDIGKIGIQDTVLLKPGRLTDEEWEIIRTHPVIGENIVKPLKFLHEERLIIRHHHERFDGKGYPDGIKGEEIPLLARILAVADTYDAMTSSRPYRTAKGHDFAVAEILQNRGTQLDPAATDAFLACIQSYGMKKAADRIPWQRISTVVQNIF